MTELTDFQQKLSALLPDMDLRFAESMAKHTSFRIGGPAEVMGFPKNPKELSSLLRTAAQLQVKPAIENMRDSSALTPMSRIKLVLSGETVQRA